MNTAGRSGSCRHRLAADGRSNWSVSDNQRVICGIERLNEVVCNSPNIPGPPQNHHILPRWDAHHGRRNDGAERDAPCPPLLAQPDILWRILLEGCGVVLQFGSHRSQPRIHAMPDRARRSLARRIEHRAALTSAPPRALPKSAPRSGCPCENSSGRTSRSANGCCRRRGRSRSRGCPGRACA